MSNYAKLKTNLKLAIQRLKLLEKKKTELSLKSRKEIADYLAINKVDRARIRVEHIIREDNYVEAMEMLEMFCDMLLARFGLIEKMKELDPGLDESIATIIWSSPRISSDILEFKTIADILGAKYGRKYADACKADSINNVNDKVKRRLGLEAPPKLLVEQYLIEIAKNFNVDYVPDSSIMLASGQMSEELIQLRDTVNDITRRNNNNNNNNNSGGSGGPAPEAAYYPEKPQNDIMAHMETPYSPPQSQNNAAAYPTQTPYYPNQPASDIKTVPIGFNESVNSNENLIDFGDLNHNNRTNTPPIPGILPVGDANLNIRGSPPPTYRANSSSDLGDSASDPVASDSSNAPAVPSKQAPCNEYDNAPPIPSKNDQNVNSDYYYPNGYHQSPPPSYAGSDNLLNYPVPPSAAQANAPSNDDELVLPSVPGNDLAPPSVDPNASIEFDDLAKRFENLKNFNK